MEGYQKYVNDKELVRLQNVQNNNKSKLPSLHILVNIIWDRLYHQLAELSSIYHLVHLIVR